MAPRCSSSISLKSKARRTYHTRLQQAILSAAAASVKSATRLLSGRYVKEPKSTSEQTGPNFLKMLRRGHPSTFRDAYGLNKHVYKRVLFELRRRSVLKDSKHIMADEQLAIFLYICTSGLSIRKAAVNLQRSIDSISKYFHHVVDALCSPEMYSAFIRLPKANNITPPEIRNSPKFYPFFKGCLGAIDGTHIYAKIPPIDRPRYRNRKGFISQNVLAAVSFDMRFVYMLSGWEGSASDGRVLEDARTTDFKIPEDKFYLGDAGFPGSKSILIPYRGVRYHLREWGAARQLPHDMKELFNLRHAQARNVVERIFGVFKKRFQIFSKPVEWPVNTQAKLVQALAVVHNIIRLYDPQDNLSDQVIETEERVNRTVDDIGRLGKELSTAEKDAAELFRDQIASDTSGKKLCARQHCLAKIVSLAI